MVILLKQRTKVFVAVASAVLVSNLLFLRAHFVDMTTAQTTQEEIRRGLSKFGLSSKSSKNLPEHAQDPTQPGNPDTKRTDQIFAEEVGRTSMLWNPFLNRGTHTIKNSIKLWLPVVYVRILTLYACPNRQLGVPSRMLHRANTA